MFQDEEFLFLFVDQILGVSRDADADTLKRAYRKLARQYHPDVNKEPGAEDKFKEIGKAYEALADPETRARYDQFGEAGLGGAAGMPDICLLYTSPSPRDP